jgi:hypothetical protein
LQEFLISLLCLFGVKKFHYFQLPCDFQSMPIKTETSPLGIPLKSPNISCVLQQFSSLGKSQIWVFSPTYFLTPCSWGKDSGKLVYARPNIDFCPKPPPTYCTFFLILRLRQAKLLPWSSPQKSICWMYHSVFCFPLWEEAGSYNSLPNVPG